jgi:uncharacterized protein
MPDDDFQMEPKKRRKNLKAHDVTFEAAMRAFDDPLALEFQDRRFAYDEERWCIIGMVDGRLLHVTFTDRDDVRHIISARGAEPHERRRYHKEAR